jgi:TonB-dependent receptor
MEAQNMCAVRTYVPLLLSLVLGTGLSLSTPSSTEAQGLAPAAGFDAGTVVGRVTDAEARPLVAAEVRVEGTALRAVTDRTGTFRIVNLPVGSHILRAEAMGYETGEAAVQIEEGTATVQNFSLRPAPLLLEGLEITGQRRGQAAALQQQRTADNIKTVVSSEFMGRFPDPNAAEAIQRLPGVSVFRDQGEGRYVLIRGSAPALSSMTINGERIPSPEGDVRYVALDVIPADLLAGIEVSKTLTPDQDADAIGGSVNLVTKSPVRGLSLFDLTLAGGYNQLTSDHIQQFAGTFARRFGADEKWGLILGGSWYNTNRGSDNIEFDWDDQDLEELQLRDYIVNRERRGITGTLDYQFDDQVSRLYLQGIWNDFSDQEFRRRTTLALLDGEAERELKDRLEIQKIMSLAGGGSQLLGSARLDYRMSYSYAEESEPKARYPVFVAEDLDFTVDRSDPDRPRYSETTGRLTDYSAFEFDGYELNDNRSTDRDFTTSLDFTVPYGLGSLPASLRLGGKARIKKKDREDNLTIYDGFDGDYVLSDVVGGFEDKGFFKGGCKGCYELGRIADGKKSWEFFQANRSLFELDGDGTRADSDAEDFDADENVFAGYVMTTVDAGRWRFIPGVRVEYTDLSYRGNEVTFDEDGDYESTRPVSETNSYVHVLPGLNMRLRLDERTNVRAALTRSLARPNYWDLVPYRLVSREDDELELGNPDLDVTTSTNVDLLFERYFQSIGLFSAGVFYKRLSDYIYESIYDVTSGPYAGYEAVQPVNGGNATLWGLEFAFNQQLTFLPGALSGLGIYANYTWTDSEAEIIGRASGNRLPGQAKHIANLSLSYEKYGFTGRLALNHFGEFIDEVGDEPSEDRIHDARSQLDLSMAYTLGRNAQLFLEVINLTDECFCFYRGDPSRPEQKEYYSRWGHLGIKLTDPLSLLR